MTRADSIASEVRAVLEGATVRDDATNATVRIVEGRRADVSLRVRIARSNTLSSFHVESRGASPPLLMYISDGTAEIAPASRAEGVVDEELRAKIAAAPRVGLEADRGTVTAGINGPLYETSEVLAAIDLVVAVRQRLTSLAAAKGSTAESTAEQEREIAALRARHEPGARGGFGARALVYFFAAVLAVAAGTCLYYSFAG